tara:strand:+ start:307 stop:756 length:450 start_codon:yes stop_codon:yes gene_type:complete
MEPQQVFDMETESDETITAVFSILEANDEQLRCIWKKIEDQAQLLKTIQGQIVLKESQLEINTAELKANHDMLFKMEYFFTNELKEIENIAEREFADVNRQIITCEQVNSIVLTIMSILLVSVMIQHYDMSNLSDYQVYKHFTLNSSEL